MIKILSSASARPNFVKLAAVHHALMDKKFAGKFEHVIVHTGQHYDPLLSDIFFTQLNIPAPAHNLGIKGGTDRLDVITQTKEAMIPVLTQEKPDIVLVYGDVNGALGAAQAAKELGIKIGHIEAGLRSFDESMPEELNRIAIDQLAYELFVTEESGMDHLQKEKVKGNVHFVGNTMIDTLFRMQTIISKEKISTDLKKFAIATIHRPSNVDDAKILRSVLDFLSAVGERCPVILPVHPRLRDALGTTKLPDTIHRMDPLGYIPFLALASKSQFIITDSGGIQEEAAFLKKRCFTLRRNTERPSTIKSGSNVLIDPESEADRKKVLDFAANPEKVTVSIPEKWDGKAGERIADALLSI
jgi:UDP-N-acetylglucosamine 2-epimerase (non-hydrolysing)